MEQVYDTKLNRGRLEEMRRHFLGHVDGFKNFKECGQTYQAQERAYEDELATIFRQEVMPLFEPFVGDASSMREQQAEKAIQALHHLLAARVLENNGGKTQNLSQGQPRFGAAPHAHLANLSGHNALAATTAFAHLLFGSEDSSVRLEKFVHTYQPLFRAAKVSREAEPSSLRTISTLVLMLAQPKEDLFVQYTPLNKASKALIGRTLVSRDPPSAVEYTECLRFARKLFKVLSDWSPQEMIDIQSFIWVYYSYGEPAEAIDGGDGDAVRPWTSAPVQRRAVDIPGVVASLQERGIRLSERTVRRYHAALRARKFVILSGVSGTGKTWLAELYAEVVGARKHIERVAPNWHSNEDLLGFVSPINNHYQDTEFSRFIRAAAETWESGDEEAQFHVILDEMNLARVEHYFSAFLSALEQRNRGDTAEIALGGDKIGLYPNLYFVGTVNMDETTHGFAPKVYDRSQLVTIDLDPEHFAEHVADWEYGDLLIEFRSILERAAPFAFRTVDDIRAYVEEARAVGASWEEAIDEAVLQKILPRISGTETPVEEALKQVAESLGEKFPLSQAKAREMLEGFLMAAPPIFEPRFLRPDGTPSEPKEWTPFILELPWTRLRVWVNNQTQPVVARCLAGRLVVGCDWPEAAVGRYRLRLHHPEFETNHTLFVPPAKMSMAALGRLLEDLHGRLPYALAVALQRGGGLAGVRLLPPEAVGISAELDRLSRVIRGDERHPGLPVLLAAIGRDPHRTLRRDEILTHVERVRRPDRGLSEARSVPPGRSTRRSPAAASGGPAGGADVRRVREPARPSDHGHGGPAAASS
jgi:hypothetical protein